MCPAAGKTGNRGSKIKRCPGCQGGNLPEQIACVGTVSQRRAINVKIHPEWCTDRPAAVVFDAHGEGCGLVDDWRRRAGLNRLNDQVRIRDCAAMDRQRQAGCVIAFVALRNGTIAICKRINMV